MKRATAAGTTRAADRHALAATDGVALVEALAGRTFADVRAAAVEHREDVVEIARRRCGGCGVKVRPADSVEIVVGETFCLPCARAAFGDAPMPEGERG